MKQWLSASELAEILHIERRSVRRRADRENWPRRTFDGRGGKEYRYHLPGLPEDVQAACAKHYGTALEALKNEIKPVVKDGLPAPKGEIACYKGRAAVEREVKEWRQLDEAGQEIARLRRKIIAAYEDERAQSKVNVKAFIERYNSGGVLPEVKEQLGRWGYLKDYRRFYGTWLAMYRQYGLSGLAPQYKDRGGMGASLSEEVKAWLEYYYLDTSQPRVPAVLACVKANHGVEVSEPTARRYLNNLPKAVLIHGRRGPRYFEEHCQPNILRDYTKYKPMDIIVGDYMTQDFVLRLKDKVWRAKVVAFMDMRTRAIVGWSLQLTANSTGVAIALQMCFDQYGLPGSIYFDNGKEFKNYWLCGDKCKSSVSRVDADDVEKNIGIVGEAGVRIVFAKPYHGQSKPIERFWRTVHEHFDKFEETYVGSNTATRPDEAKVYLQKVAKMKKEDFEKIPTFEQVKERLGHFFAYYNSEMKHTGQGMDGKPPMRVWAENAVERRDVPEELKPYLFTYRYERTVRNQGIEYNGGWYYNADKNAEYLGRKVQIRVPLEGDDFVYVFDFKGGIAGEQLFTAEYFESSGDVAADNEAMGKIRKGNRALVREHNKGKAELDKQPFLTPAEIYAREHPQEAALKVVGGDALAPAPEQPELKLVRPRKSKYSVFK
jgi:putative transposase